MGLRETKKAQTRALIADTAWRLFTGRGFDRVTVAEIAREAQVAEATVFNYFASKEDLFYFRFDAYGSAMVEAVRMRPAGQSVLVAVRRFLLAGGSLLDRVEAGDAAALESLRTVHGVIAASPTLLARERQAIARHTDSLAALLAAETGAPADDVRANVAANALMGVHRALLDHVRRRVLADDAPERLATDVRRLGRRAFALLENGLRDYAVRPQRHGRPPGRTEARAVGSATRR